MTRELNIICQACKLPLGDKIDDPTSYGNLWFSDQDYDRRVNARREWESKYSSVDEYGDRSTVADGTALMTHPERAHWTAHHGACDDMAVSAMYYIPSIKLRTWADFTIWSAQIMEKRWASDTNWVELMRSVGDGDGGLIVPVVPPTVHAH